MEIAPTRYLQKRANAGRGARLMSYARMPVLLAALILTFFASPARPIEVAPITVEIPAGQKTATLTLSNRNPDKATIQVRIFAWDQAGGADRLSPTTEMRISPPFVTLPAGETQLVRVLLAKSPIDKEASYRILIDEIPPPNTPGNIKLLLRISLPVFAAPKGRVAAAVTWRAVQTEKDGLQLIGTNRGTRRARILDLKVTPDGSAASLGVRANANPYILPGAERRWALTGATSAIRAGTALRVSANSDEGHIDARPIVSSP